MSTHDLRHKGAGVLGAVLALVVCWLLVATPSALAQSAAIQPPATPAAEYQLSLVREGNTLAMGGVLPGEPAREAILAALRAVEPDIGIMDMSEVRDGTSEPFAAAATLAATLVMKLKPGAVLIEGGSLSIEGRPDGDMSRAAIASALASLPAGLALQRVALALPVAKPFTQTIRRDGDRLILEGVASSEDDRAAIAEAARTAAPGLPLTDRMTLADGAPAGVDRAAVARLAALVAGRLQAGVARLSDATLSVEGQAADRSGYVAAQRALREALPTGVTLGAVAIRAPVVAPYRWFIDKGPEGILVQGYVPSEEAHAAAKAAIAGQFGALRLRDNLEIAEGAPDGFGDAVAAAVKQLALLPRGRVNLDNRSIAVTGDVPSAVYANAARAALRRLAPEGWAFSETITAPVAVTAPPVTVAPAAPPVRASVDTCSPKISEEMAAGGIVFQFGRETMRPDSIARLRRIAAIMKGCPDVRFSIEGHTDSDGNPEQNVDLSLRRAQAVVGLLIRQGIEAGRLLAEGHGESRPLVANDSAANKARNRRIEFVTR
ncbi:MAG: OmpA family protein [Phreatobacter sp.]|uniref:OmpA family protein n=1 Tax=Phreatobacter sp. TaxID=1966341 RepID=UPI001A389A9D|nr:OmpA family protein [Phreatobacter sp.]MBL8569865.1 OmpA family protein [Phreatobacter sp.]